MSTKLSSTSNSLCFCSFNFRLLKYGMQTGIQTMATFTLANLEKFLLVKNRGNVVKNWGNIDKIGKSGNFEAFHFFFYIRAWYDI